MTLPPLPDLREALSALLKYAEINECQHDETHRGGVIWTICDGCGRKWADDRNPFKGYQEPAAITNARAAIAAHVPEAAFGNIAAVPAQPVLDCEIQPRPLAYPLTDYHSAGIDGPLNYTWKDKPHRLLYDLIAAVRYYAAPQAVPVPAWQPIETAPRGSGEDGPAMVNDPDYVAPPQLLLMTPDGMTVGAYDWYYHAGYGRGAEPGVPAWRQSLSSEPIYDATHWMPLPAAPKEQP